MTKLNPELQKSTVPPGRESRDEESRSGFENGDFAELNWIVQSPSLPLHDSEKELIRELVHALRTIRFGSIVLTVHDGQLVEINKSVRIRKHRASQKE